MELRKEMMAEIMGDLFLGVEDLVDVLGVNVVKEEGIGQLEPLL